MSSSVRPAQAGPLESEWLQSVPGKADAQSKRSGWAGWGPVGEEAGGLAEGMQIGIMNYASARASHTLGLNEIMFSWEGGGEDRTKMCRAWPRRWESVSY